MKISTTLSLTAALLLADSGELRAGMHQGGHAPEASSEAASGGAPHDMMQHMMQMMMHMEGGDDETGLSGMAMMNPDMMQLMMGMFGSTAGQARHEMMMDLDMMRVMMGGRTMGMPVLDDLRETLQSRMTEFDADGSGTLSIDEFETLHSAMIREVMVDRFQFLDADGDGKITADEMDAPAARLGLQGATGEIAEPPPPVPQRPGAAENEHDDH